MIASLSLDLDNKWSYMKTRGDARWSAFPSYLPIVVPRVLDILKRRRQSITFFVVGQDAALQQDRAVLRSIAEAGHEIGNHSFHHEPWLHLYTPEQIEREIASAEEAIAEATGFRTRGFRGPGFSMSPDVLATLARRGYAYDASTFPTFLGPLARAYYFMTAKIGEQEAEERKQLFGSLSDGLRPLHTYSWRVANRELLEIPVTTMPLLRTPIHASYILYAASFAPALAKAYFRLALSLCAMAKVQPSLLLHPLDFLTLAEAPELEFFPAMRMPLDQKLRMMDFILDEFSSRFEVLNMGAHARAAVSDPLGVRRVAA